MDRFEEEEDLLWEIQGIAYNIDSYICCDITREGAPPASLALDVIEEQAQFILGLVNRLREKYPKPPQGEEAKP